MRHDLTFLCHAATSATRLSAFPADDPLEDAGRARAVLAAGSFARSAYVWCAPSLAAQETASACGLRATAEPAIRDCDFGRWSGRALADVGRDEPDAFRAWITDPSSSPHGGEALDALLTRVGAWLDERRSVAGSTIAVTHPAVIRAGVVHALEASMATFWHLDIAPLSRAALRTDGRRWMLRGLYE